MKRAFTLYFILLIGTFTSFALTNSSAKEDTIYAENTIVLMKQSTKDELTEIKESIIETKNDSKDLYFSLVYIVAFVIAATSIAIPLIINTTYYKQFQDKINQQKQDFDRQKQNINEQNLKQEKKINEQQIGFENNFNTLRSVHIYLMGLGLDMDLRNDEKVDSRNYFCTSKNNSNIKKIHNYQEQIIYYNKAINYDTNFYLAYFRRGIAYTELANLMNNNEEKIMYINNAIKDYNSCIKHIDKDKDLILIKNTIEDYNCCIEHIDKDKDLAKLYRWKIYINLSRAQRLYLINDLIDKNSYERIYKNISINLNNALKHSDDEKEYTSYDIIEIELIMAKKESTKSELYLNKAIDKLNDAINNCNSICLKKESNIGILAYRIAKLLPDNKDIITKEKHYSMAIKYLKQALQKDIIYTDYYAILGNSYFNMAKLYKKNELYIYAIYYFDTFHQLLNSQNYIKSNLNIDLMEVYKLFCECCIALSQRDFSSLSSNSNQPIAYWFNKRCKQGINCINYIFCINEEIFISPHFGSKEWYITLKHNFENISSAYERCIDEKMCNDTNTTTNKLCPDIKERCKALILACDKHINSFEKDILS